ncbi:inositol monophosphatase [Lutimaribacter sp. EGI FJ00015]|uniref:Inositol monophosphatase n=1 Tax=Lutimaribacter degradans TaxID=2945989 RepID=A0ACC5ZUA2_9RHOB|nr:inositol monophosphatase [Lutimaribacter sp. EGI FJ00013]MCM2561528.1 inositol monophosphatase [Lutimaribacter sp. EGI FJ00013]MCO0612761.1 inositol monophosphatase [Lutimaribacter sp. EGI FJ00015]MCO0635419.1 inositol monophosphatase [Lutimaribacter sp. EGI FJ00014]
MTLDLPAIVTGPLTSAQRTSLINIIRRAARTEILPRFRRLAGAQIATKSGPDDIVTEADTAAEAMIARGLARMFPGAVIIGEEAAASDPSLRHKAAEAELAFIIDPVDGTWNFAHGLGVFGVILAATRYGRPVFGLIYDPLADDYVIADESSPARHVTASGQETPLTMSGGGPIDRLSGYTHMSLMPKDAQKTLAPLQTAFARTGALRCSAHEYRLAALGHADFILSGTLNPWDHAAGVLICQRAGGVARMLDGADYTIAQDAGYLLTAADDATWDAVADVLEPLLG